MVDESGSRRQTAEERREQILDAALRVFSEKGYNGASIRDIAREVGVTEGLLYHYFASKEQILHACWKEHSWHTHLQRILGSSEGVPLEQVLRALVIDFLQSLYEKAPMVRMCASEMQHNSEIAAFYMERIEENQRLIHHFLHTRQLNGEIRPDADLAVVAGLLMGSAYSLFLLYNRADPETWERMVHSLAHGGIDVIMQGIVPRNSS
jgi:AcrR family transcriptional regulator